MACGRSAEAGWDVSTPSLEVEDLLGNRNQPTGVGSERPDVALAIPVRRARAVVAVGGLAGALPVEGEADRGDGSALAGAQAAGAADGGGQGRVGNEARGVEGGGVGGASRRHEGGRLGRRDGRGAGEGRHAQQGGEEQQCGAHSHSGLLWDEVRFRPVSLIKVPAGRPNGTAAPGRGLHLISLHGLKTGREPVGRPHRAAPTATVSSDIP